MVMNIQMMKWMKSTSSLSLQKAKEVSNLLDSLSDILEREVFYMNTYEELQEEACKDGIDVIDYPFENKRIKGLYCDGTVAIRDNIDTTAEKACVLAEELGHHYTSVGNIIDMEYTGNRKQERQARLWGYNRSIGLLGLFRAYEHGCKDKL